MTCPSCEQPVEDAALFCGNCGFRVRQEAVPAPISEAVVPAVTVSAPAPTPVADVPAATPVAASPVPMAPTASPQPIVPTQPSQSPQPIPGYAVPQAKPTESHTLELVLSIVSIPAALFPLLGFCLSIPALVLARKHKATAPTVLSIIGVVLSTIAVVFNIVYYIQHPEEQGRKPSSTVVITPLRTLSD